MKRLKKPHLKDDDWLVIVAILVPLTLFFTSKIISYCYFPHEVIDDELIVIFKSNITVEEAKSIISTEYNLTIVECYTGGENVKLIVKVPPDKIDYYKELLENDPRIYRVQPNAIVI